MASCKVLQPHSCLLELGQGCWVVQLQSAIIKLIFYEYLHAIYIKMTVTETDKYIRYVVQSEQKKSEACERI